VRPVERVGVFRSVPFCPLVTNYLRETHLKIVVLDEEDLLSMLDYVGFGRSPLDVTEKKYYELLKRLQYKE
jgi:hypothetical protein